MNWLADWYQKHPEYRRLRSRQTPNSIHFQIAPDTYEAHIWIDPRFVRCERGWLPFSGFVDAIRLAQRMLTPRQLAQFAAMLPFGTVLTLQPAAAAGKDNRLPAGPFATWNYGTSNMVLGNSAASGLIEFDFSSIPSSATCSSAIISFYMVSSGAAQAFTVTLYSISAANAAWQEGTKNGALAGAGESCLNALAADGAGGVTTAWASGGVFGTAGTDYENIVLGSFSGNRSDANGTEYSTALTATRVQGWFGAVNTNYGLCLITAVGGALGSSDHATAGWRPKLVVTYALPGGGIFNQPFSGALRGPFG